MTHIRSQKLILALVALIAIFLIVLLVMRSESVSSFEECVEAGNPVMESYPRQCQSADGEIFVEDVPLPTDNGTSTEGLPVPPEE